MKFHLTYSVLLVLALTSRGQEFLSPLPGNPELKDQLWGAQLKNASTTALPFFDDFADANNPYPNTANWVENKVYINTQYAKGPVSIGVATFDAVDANGYHYENASSSPFIADMLTSRTINLANADANTLYLSFFYQPQGVGEQPEANDSLVLQFLTVDTVWQTVWYATGKSFAEFRLNDLGLATTYAKDTVEFKYVSLNINNPAFLHQNFKFRFFNYASLNSLGNPSDATNCDHWNLDYVYLDELRDGSIKLQNDVGMVEPPNSFINVYNAVPWAHFNENENNRFRDVYIHLRNNSEVERTLNQITLYLENLATHKVDSFDLGNLESIEPYLNNREKRKSFSNSPIVWSAGENAHYQMKATFFTDNADYKVNNSAYRNLTFENYYAYDDGTAENSYGINTPDANVALRYTTYKPDSLRAIQMYFLRNNPQSAAADGFKLCVWDDNNGKPGNLLVERKGKVPEFNDELNQLVTYNLDTAIFIEDNFFIGWTQTTDLRLNVGFDANTNYQDRLFYNVYGTWVNSDFVGSLMLRPVFGQQVTSGIEFQEKMAEIALYPNPANDYVTISEIPNDKLMVYTIYNSQGAMLRTAPFNGEPVSVESLPVGLYIIKLTTQKGEIFTQKLFIAR